MNLTNNKNREELTNSLRNFVASKICVKNDDNDKAKLIPMAPEKNIDSYFVTRTSSSDSGLSSEINCNSAIELKEVMEKFWVDEPELRDLVESLVDFAEKMDNNLELDDELPSFIYTL